MSEQIKTELEAKLGPVKRVKFFEFHPEGVVEVKFEHAKDAEECITLMNGRFFNQRQIDCFYYDGETDYAHIREDLEDEQKRIEDFGKWMTENKNDSITQKEDIKMVIEEKEEEFVDQDAPTDEEDE